MPVQGPEQAGRRGVNARPDVTEMLRRWADGDSAALDALMPVVYDELRSIARGYLRREADHHTLGATALVNEAFLRLAGQARVDWRERADELHPERVVSDREHGLALGEEQCVALAAREPAQGLVRLPAIGLEGERRDGLRRRRHGCEEEAREGQ